MNDQLQIALAAIIDKATQGIDSSVGFLQAQLPDVIQQLLLWKMARSAILCVLAVVLLAVVIALAIKGWQWVERKEKKAGGFEKGDFRFTAAWLSLMLGAPLVLVCFAIITDLTWLQILIAPKVYLIEYAATLAKGG